MEIKIDPFNAILFEFEDAQQALEDIYERMRAEFNLDSFRYLKMKRCGAGEGELMPLLRQLTDRHEGLRIQSLQLRDVYDEHRNLVRLIEHRIKQREEAGGSP